MVRSARRLLHGLLISYCFGLCPAVATTIAVAVWSDGALAAKTLDQGQQRCGDFLAQMHLKPRGVRYIGCSGWPDRQGKPLRATYHVPGFSAARMERLLIKAVGMPALRRSCCRWDAPPHWFRGADGHQYGITMVSGETGVMTRAAWPGIPVFEIVIENHTERI